MPATPAAAMPLRASDLVWRKRADDPSSGTAERSLGTLAGSAAPAINSPHPARSAPAPETIDALRPRLLDPALMDRVAEDVIGRVEKRIRI